MCVCVLFYYIRILVYIRFHDDGDVFGLPAPPPRKMLQLFLLYLDSIRETFTPLGPPPPLLVIFLIFLTM